MSYYLPENVNTDCGVYRIVNRSSGKCYIGSSINLTSRKKDHFKALRAGKHHSAHLQRAYDIEADKSVFEFHAFIYCSKADLIAMEQSCLTVMKPDYNISKIAGRLEQTPEIREKIRKANTGKKRTAETRALLSAQASERTGEKNHFSGKSHSIETKMAIGAKARERQAAKGHPRVGATHSAETKSRLSEVASLKVGDKNSNAKAIVELSTGRIFSFIREAASFYGVSHQHISKVCKGERTHTGGYKFAYLNSPAGSAAAHKYEGV